MVFKTLIGLLIVLIGCSSNQQTSKGGLRIENGINRGTRYTDSLGTNYGITYIPITITNDSTIPMHLQIAFSNEYDFPHPDSDEKFKLIPLPKEWALDGVEITESMINELPKYIDKPLLNETIEPGEKIVVAIGTLRPVPTNCSPIPNVLFTYSNSDNFKACDSLMNQDKSANSQLVLGVKLDYCGGRCIIIPCGLVS
jgi:hypothetical protein